MDKTLAIAVAVLVIGMALIVNGLSKAGITGYATAWGSVNLTVTSSTAITLITDTVDLGQLVSGTSNDTVGDQASDPLPFKIRNDGNIPINISIQATNLFTTAPNPSIYFQARCQNTTEWNCANGTVPYRNASILRFTDIPASGSPRVFIANLTSADAYDQAKLDINVTVPAEESAGAKGGTVTFTSTACLC